MTNARIIVVGAGPAGIRAAAAMAAAGLRPVIVDEAPDAGGQIYRQPPPGFRRPGRALYGLEAAKAGRLHGAFGRFARFVDYRPETMAWNIKDRTLYTVRGETVARIPFDAMVLATGARDRVLPFPGWTTPGVFTIGGAQIALKYQGCAIGRRTAFLGSTPLLYRAASQYAAAGARVAAVLDTTPFRRKVAAVPGLLAGGGTFAKGLMDLGALKARRVPVRHGIRPVSVTGNGAVGGLLYREAGGRERHIACDAVAFGFGLEPESVLADIAGRPFRFDPAFRLWVPEGDDRGRAGDGIYLAGDGVRIGGADAAEAAGELAARALIADLGIAPADTGREAVLGRRLARLHRFQAALAAAFPVPRDLARSLPDDVIVCRCEVITAGEIRAAAKGDPPASEINRLKAFIRVGMGRCQGRCCGTAAAEILADALGQDVAAVGRPRGAGPARPLPLAAVLEASITTPPSPSDPARLEDRRLAS